MHSWTTLSGQAAKNECWHGADRANGWREWQKIGHQFHSGMWVIFTVRVWRLREGTFQKGVCGKGWKGSATPSELLSGDSTMIGALVQKLLCRPPNLTINSVPFITERHFQSWHGLVSTRWCGCGCRMRRNPSRPMWFMVHVVGDAMFPNPKSTCFMSLQELHVPQTRWIR